MVRELFLATVWPGANSMDVTMGTDGRKFILNERESWKKSRRQKRSDSYNCVRGQEGLIIVEEL